MIVDEPIEVFIKPEHLVSLRVDPDPSLAVSGHVDSEAVFSILVSCGLHRTVDARLVIDEKRRTAFEL